MRYYKFEFLSILFHTTIITNNTCLHIGIPYGDSMIVSLPDVDRGRADPRNIIFAVKSSIEDGQFYKIGNKYGTCHSYTPEISLMLIFYL